jgi:hypothetical protein
VQGAALDVQATAVRPVEQANKVVLFQHNDVEEGRPRSRPLRHPNAPEIEPSSAVRLGCALHEERQIGLIAREPHGLFSRSSGVSDVAICHFKVLSTGDMSFIHPVEVGAKAGQESVQGQDWERQGLNILGHDQCSTWSY